MGLAGQNNLCNKPFQSNLSFSKPETETSHSLSVPIYIFFPTRCKFLLGELQSLFNLATTDKLNETLLLQVEK
jgi:hypothetical protein